MTSLGIRFLQGAGAGAALSVVALGVGGGPRIVIGLFAAAAVGATTAALLLDRPQQPALEGAVAEPIALPPGEHGLALQGNYVIVTDATDFFNYVAIVAEPVIARGGDAEDVAIEIFSKRFPEQAWPPASDAAREQWDFIVKRIAAHLDRGPSPGRPQLRVVS